MIRPMTSNDIRHVQHIARNTWSDTYDGIIPENIQSVFIDRFLFRCNDVNAYGKDDCSHCRM